MTLLRQRRIAILIAGLSLAGSSSAEVDPVQLELLRQYRQPLRWDSAERHLADGSPYWRDGEVPHKDKAGRGHFVRLAPGQQITVFVPAGEYLRLQSRTNPFSIDALQVAFSQDSRLFAEQTAQVGADGRSWLFRAPELMPVLARVSRSATASAALDAGVFVSRREVLATIAPYRRVLPLPAPEVDLRPGVDAAGQRYWRLEPGRIVRVKVRGPRRLALAARLHYPAGESRRQQDWTVLMQLEDVRLAAWQVKTGAETAFAVMVDGNETPVSREKEGYVDVPPGEHTLSIDASAPLFARLLEQERSDYLLPALNEPDRAADELANPEPPLRLKLSTWLQSAEETQNPLQAADVNAAEVRQGGLRLIEDNRLREGGLIATRALLNAGERRRDDPTVRAEAIESLGLHTFYRDLLPAQRTSSGEMRFAWFAAPRLRGISERGRGIAVFAQHADDLLDTLESGWFVPVPARVEASAQEIISDRRRRIVLADAALFGNDSYRLRAEGDAMLASLAERLRAEAEGVIEIVGHTDSRASAEYNQRLSERRAGAVARALNGLGIAANRLKIRGAGLHEPRADNATVEGRQKNRRVEISFRSLTQVHKPPPVRRQTYLLPERPAGSWLRVALQAEAGQGRVYLQYDSEPPRLLDMGAAVVSAEAFSPSLAEAGLLLNAIDHGEFGGSTLSADFSRTRPPAGLIRAGVFDLDLPRHVREIRVWRADDASGAMRIALKYRAGKPWQLGEQAYLEAVRRGGTDQLLERFVKTMASDVPDLNDIASAELDSHWQALARLVRSQSRTFFAGIATDTPVTKLPGSPDAALAEGDTLAQAGRWLPALEAWSAARYQESDPAKAAAIDRKRIEALDQLGEDFLATRWLRQRLRDATDPAVRDEARVSLERLARQDDDRAALLGIAAANVQRWPQPDNLRRLAEALWLNDESTLALQCALLLPEHQRDHELILRVSLKLGWWQIFEQSLKRLSSVERQAFWRGQRDMLAGRTGDALREWQQGDAEAQAYARHAEAAEALHQRMKGRRDAVTLDDWAKWQAGHPGAWQWQDNPSFIIDAAGSEALYAIDRDAYGIAWRATPDRPVRARFIGPLRVRIEGRLLYAAGSKQTAGGWLRVRAADQLWVTPISNNYPASGLVLAGNVQQVPGRKEIQEIAFGPGLHEIEIDGEQQALLVRVEALRPDLPIGLLPTLTPETAQAPIAISDKPATRGDGGLLGCRDCMTVVPDPAFPTGRATTYPLPESDPDERFNIPLVPVSPASHDTVAGLAAAGRWDDLLALPHPADDDALRYRLGLYVWIAEHVPEQYSRLLAAGSALFEAHPQVSGLGALLNRLARNSGWVPLESVDASRGLRSVEVDRWQPESPALRTRRALLSPLAADEQVVTGSNRLVLAHFNPDSTKLHLDLVAEELPFQLPGPMTVSIEVDDKAWRQVLLTPEAPSRKLEIGLNSGRHSIRIGIEQPFANQFLRVRLANGQQQGTVTRVERFYQVASAAEPLRVSLPGPQWLRIDELLDGRVISTYRHLDREWQEVVLAPPAGKDEALYRLHLRTPLPDQQQAPPRMVEMATEPVPLPNIRIDEPLHPPQVRLLDGLDLDGQADGTWSFSLSVRSRPYSFDDPAYRSSVARQLAAATLPSGDSIRLHDYLLGHQNEKYLEGAATWRYRDAELSHYREGMLLFRQREVGGSVLGVKGRLDFEPTWATWNAGLDGSLFTQKPGAENFDSAVPPGFFGLPNTVSRFHRQLDRREWSSILRGYVGQKRDIDPKTWHLPRAALFYRRTSLNDYLLPPYGSGKVDQDIYTPYSSDHDLGIELGDTLEHRPWLDTLWYAGVAVTSNPDLDLANPDHMATRLGWRQLLNQGWMSAGWEHKHFSADDHRTQAASTRSIGLDAGFELWRGPWQRIELRANFDRDLTRKNTAANMQLIWHTGNGRGFRDFRSGEVDFRELRERHRPAEPNHDVDDTQ